MVVPLISLQGVVVKVHSQEDDASVPNQVHNDIVAFQQDKEVVEDVDDFLNLPDPIQIQVIDDNLDFDRQIKIQWPIQPRFYSQTSSHDMRFNSFKSANR